jgi:hypothetical protein
MNNLLYQMLPWAGISQKCVYSCVFMLVEVHNALQAFPFADPQIEHRDIEEENKTR